MHESIDCIRQMAPMCWAAHVGLGHMSWHLDQFIRFFSELICLYSKNTNIRTYYGTCNICVAIGRIYAMHAMWPYNADDQLRNQDSRVLLNNC